MRRLTATAFLLATLWACGGGSSSPTQPTPTPTPTPTPSMFTLSGTVTETVTPDVRIASARVEIVSGTNAGASTQTDGSGQYSIPNLSGDVSVRVTANGYAETSGNRSMTQNQTLNAQLRPEYRPLNQEFTGALSGGDPTCSDGVFTKPCKVITLPIHNSGILEASMGWAGSADLDLTLFRSGSVVVSSRGVGSQERISTNVTAGVYELRVTYYQGAAIATYTLKVSRPN